MFVEWNRAILRNDDGSRAEEGYQWRVVEEIYTNGDIWGTIEVLTDSGETIVSPKGQCNLAYFPWDVYKPDEAKALAQKALGMKDAPDRIIKMVGAETYALEVRYLPSMTGAVQDREVLYTHTTPYTEKVYFDEGKLLNDPSAYKEVEKTSKFEELITKNVPANILELAQETPPEKWWRMLTGPKEAPYTHGDDAMFADPSDYGQYGND